jgi:UDP-N-acetylmuramate dehydrogenase
VTQAPARIVENVPLAEHVTLGVGGAAAFFCEAATVDEARGAMGWARDRGLEVLVLGGGSNLVVSDRGFGGLVLRLTMKQRFHEGDRLRVEAGHEWDALVAHAVRENLAGLECLSGIPGSVGATPIQNVGAYGQEVAETITEVLVLDRTTGLVRAMSKDECAFGYRDSAFKRGLRGRLVVLEVTFELESGGKPAVRYPELERHLATAGLREPTLADVRASIVRLRKAKSMVLDPDDENRRSAGSFFMNPVVPEEVAAEALRRATLRGALAGGERMPAFAAGGGRTKLSAAWLIERAGFARGTTDGRVGISTRHSLALVNKGGATAAELLAFARRVREGVFAAFGVRLVPEPELVGFSAEEIADLTGPD